MSRLTKTRGCRWRTLLTNNFFYKKRIVGLCRGSYVELRQHLARSPHKKVRIEHFQQSYAMRVKHCFMPGDFLPMPLQQPLKVRKRAMSKIFHPPCLMYSSTRKPGRNDSSLMRCLTRQRYDQDHVWWRSNSARTNHGTTRHACNIIK